jgi:hypothetical protein
MTATWSSFLKQQHISLPFFWTMAETQSQPAVMPEFNAERHAVDKDTLIARLDELLEKYLHTLDEYQKAREQFSKQLSSVGYFPKTYHRRNIC